MLYFATVKIKNKQGQELEGVSITEMPRHAYWGWQALSHTAVMSVRELALHWEVTLLVWHQRPLTDTSHYGLPLRCFHNLATQGSLGTCSFWQPWKHKKSVSLRPQQAPLPVLELGPVKGPDIWHSKCRKASPGIHHFPCHRATVVKIKGGGWFPTWKCDKAEWSATETILRNVTAWDASDYRGILIKELLSARARKLPRQSGKSVLWPLDEGCSNHPGSPHWVPFRGMEPLHPQTLSEPTHCWLFRTHRIQDVG